MINQYKTCLKNDSMTVLRGGGGSAEKWHITWGGRGGGSARPQINITLVMDDPLSILNDNTRPSVSQLRFSMQNSFLTKLAVPYLFRLLFLIMLNEDDKKLQSLNESSWMSISWQCKISILLSLTKSSICDCFEEGRPVYPLILRYDLKKIFDFSVVEAIMIEGIPDGLPGLLRLGDFPSWEPLWPLLVLFWLPMLLVLSVRCLDFLAFTLSSIWFLIWRYLSLWTESAWFMESSMVQ